MTSLLDTRSKRAATLETAERAEAAPERWLPIGLLAIGVGLAAVALLGPLATGAIDYRVSETLRNQTIGLDAVSLLVVAPLAAWAALLTRRGHPAGPALALGIGAYTSYMFLQYVVGPDYAHLAGNNQLLFPLCLVLFTAGWAVVLRAWAIFDADWAALLPHPARLIGRVVLPVLAFVAFVRYVPMLADAMRSSPADKGYLAGPTFFWAIALLDLGVFLPLTVAACVGIRRGARWAPRALFTAVGWLGLVGPAVAAMGIAMVANGDPNGSAGAAAFMAVLGLAFTAAAVALFRPLFSGRV
jgi:hypothetical protein